MTPNFRRKRAGFTLVELLVVIAIIAFLAALVIAFFPSINAQSAEANGALNLQGWLNIARQKAIRNQNPYGLRLWVNSQNLAAMQVVECQYIEQPDDFNSGLITTSSSANNGVFDTVNFQDPAADLTGGFGMGDPSLFPVLAGDYLEFMGTGIMHRVIGVTSPTTLMIATSAPFQITTATLSYRILRQPRVIGSEMLPLPTGVVIDLNTNLNNNNAPALFASQFANPLPIVPVFPPPPPNPPPQTGAFVDVLFAPSGAVLTSGVTQNSMNFWVRQPDSNNPGNVFAGNPTIIAVFVNTGLIGAYPPTASQANPYFDVH